VPVTQDFHAESHDVKELSASFVWAWGFDIAAVSVDSGEHRNWGSPLRSHPWPHGRRQGRVGSGQRGEILCKKHTASTGRRYFPGRIRRGLSIYAAASRPVPWQRHRTPAGLTEIYGPLRHERSSIRVLSVSLDSSVEPGPSRQRFITG
jgi:hypothetical protein